MIALPAIRSRKPVSATAGIRKRRDNSEEILQAAVCRFLDHALAGNSYYHSCPNGGYRRKTEARRLKKTGVKRGAPDLIVINDGRYIGLEMKTPKGVVSDDQLYCHAQIRKARAPVYICRSVEEVEAALRAAGVPLRVKVAA